MAAIVLHVGNTIKKASKFVMDNSVKTISVAEMRAADKYTIEECGVPSLELMKRAAQGVYDAYDGWEGKKTLIICGSGNNGGDGYALAGIMKDKGHDVTVMPLSDKFSVDGKHYYDICLEKGVPMIPGAGEDYDIIVDCIFGTGFSGRPRELEEAIIGAINQARNDGTYIISVDINSGMNGDTGEGDVAVYSDLTVSIGYYKHGFFKGRADELIGKLVNVDIGIKLPE